MDLRDKIAKNVLDVILRKFKTLKDAAAACGIGHSEFSKMRQNTARITVPFLMSVAKGTGCRYSDLFQCGKRKYPNLPIGKTYLARIKSRRVELGVTTKDVAKHIGVRESTYRAFEREGVIMPEKFEKITDMLQISPEYLRGKKEPPVQQDLFPKEEETKSTLVVDGQIIIEQRGGLVTKITIVPMSGQKK